MYLTTDLSYLWTETRKTYIYFKTHIIVSLIQKEIRKGGIILLQEKTATIKACKSDLKFKESSLLCSCFLYVWQETIETSCLFFYTHVSPWHLVWKRASSI